MSRVGDLRAQLAVVTAERDEARAVHEGTCDSVGELRAMVAAYRDMRARAEAAEKERDAIVRRVRERDALPAPRPGEGHWRVGRTLGRTLYRDGEVVGMVDTMEIARDIVTAMNAARKGGA